MAKSSGVDGLITSIPTINTIAGERLVREAKRIAKKKRASGYAAVFSRTGMLEAALAVGSGTPRDRVVAESMIKTVLLMRVSTSLVRDILWGRLLTQVDFGGQLGSILSGGVAIFYKGEFVGAVAFFGGTDCPNEDICVKAVIAVGLETDIKPKPSEPVVATCAG
jgi:uncharacterized protein GlcG (DUF336 family)